MKSIYRLIIKEQATQNLRIQKEIVEVTELKNEENILGFRNVGKATDLSNMMLKNLIKIYFLPAVCRFSKLQQMSFKSHVPDGKRLIFPKVLMKFSYSNLDTGKKKWCKI